MSCLSTAIKVSCIGSCGVSNKINDTAWTVEEQYFNSTLSLADKGTVLKGLVEICGSEMLYRNVSPRPQHPLDVKYPSQAALACAQRMGARIRDYKSLAGAVQRRILSRTWQPPCKHCLASCGPEAELSQGLLPVSRLCGFTLLCFLRVLFMVVTKH